MLMYGTQWGTLAALADYKKTVIFYYKSHRNLYQVLQVTFVQLNAQ